MFADWRVPPFGKLIRTRQRCECHCFGKAGRPLTFQR